MKVTLTGLPDGEWSNDLKVGERASFYNGYMSDLDGKECVVIETNQYQGKIRVRFEDGSTFLAYNTELKRI